MLELHDFPQTQSAFPKTSGSKEGAAVARQRQTLPYQTLPCRLSWYPGDILGVPWGSPWVYPGDNLGDTLGIS